MLVACPQNDKFQEMKRAARLRAALFLGEKLF
jgi:hypothetical protein